MSETGRDECNPKAHEKRYEDVPPFQTFHVRLAYSPLNGELTRSDRIDTKADGKHEIDPNKGTEPVCDAHRRQEEVDRRTARHGVGSTLR